MALRNGIWLITPILTLYQAASGFRWETDLDRARYPIKCIRPRQSVRFTAVI